MPYELRKLRDKNQYKVINKETKAVKAFGTTLAKAEKQVRLLRGIEHGLIPRKKS